MNLFAAALSSVWLGLMGASSTCLIFWKYWRTRVSSVKTACSLALTPLRLRYARSDVRNNESFH